MLQKVILLAEISAWKLFTCFKVLLHFVEGHAFSRAVTGRLESSTSIATSSTGGSLGGSVPCRPELHKCSNWWRWYTTLLRYGPCSPPSGCRCRVYKRSLKSFKIHLCFTLQRLTHVALRGERERSGAQQYHKPSQTTPPHRVACTCEREAVTARTEASTHTLTTQHCSLSCADRSTTSASKFVPE